MLTKSLGSSLVAGAVIAAGTQAYADTNVTQSTSKVDLGQKNLSPGFLFPVPASGIDGALLADKGVTGDLIKAITKQFYYSYPSFWGGGSFGPGYYTPIYGPAYGPVYGPAYGPSANIYIPPCGVNVVPYAALTALSLGAMSIQARRRRPKPSE